MQGTPRIQGSEGSSDFWNAIPIPLCKYLDFSTPPLRRAKAPLAATRWSSRLHTRPSLPRSLPAACLHGDKSEDHLFEPRVNNCWLGKLITSPSSCKLVSLRALPPSRFCLLRCFSRLTAWTRSLHFTIAREFAIKDPSVRQGRRPLTRISSHRREHHHISQEHSRCLPRMSRAQMARSQLLLPQI